MRLLLPLLALIALAGTGFATANSNVYAEPAAGVHSLYMQGTVAVTTTSTMPAPIPGMHLKLPAATSSTRYALVTFNANASDQSRCIFWVFGGSTQYASGTTVGPFVPITLVTKVPLAAQSQMLQVEWNTLSASNQCALIGAFSGPPSPFYSLSAILTAD